MVVAVSAAVAVVSVAVTPRERSKPLTGTPNMVIAEDSMVVVVTLDAVTPLDTKRLMYDMLCPRVTWETHWEGKTGSVGWGTRSEYWLS